MHYTNLAVPVSFFSAISVLCHIVSYDIIRAVRDWNAVSYIV